MKFIFTFFIMSYYGLVSAQTYQTTTQGKNNSAGGAYVAPVVTKTYTTPATSNTTPARVPAANTSSFGNGPGSGSNNSAEGTSVSSNNNVNSRFYHVFTFVDANGLRIALNQKGDKRGFIDAENNVVIPLIYEDAMPGNSGYYAVKSEGKWGFVDKNNKQLIAFKYDEIKVNFKKSLGTDFATVVKNGKTIIISKEIDLAFDKADFTNKYNSVGSFNDGLALVNLKGKYGYINEAGEEVVPLIYDYSQDFREGRACVSLYAKDKKNLLYSKFGFINKSGNVVVPIIYEKVYLGFDHGWALVKLEGKWGYIDTLGKTVLPFKHDEASLFREGLAAIQLKGKWGYMDKQGKTVIDCKYDNDAYFNNGLACISFKGKWGIIDQTGKEIIPFKFDRIAPGGFYQGMASFQSGSKWGSINEKGEEVLPPVYDASFYFKNDKAEVLLNGRKFYIDKSGKEVSQ